MTSSTLMELERRWGLESPGERPRIAPPSALEVAEALAIARSMGLLVDPVGMGARRHWGGERPSDLELGTSRLDRIRHYAPDDMVVVAEAGMTLADLNALVAARGQILPLEVSAPGRTTLGGLVAAAPMAIARSGHGQVRDWLLGVEVATPDGVLVHGGGQVVKNVAGYDLCKLYCGSLGALGVVTAVTFKVRPRWEATALVSKRVAGVEDLAIAAATDLAPTLVVLEWDAEGDRLWLGFDGAAAAVAWQADAAITRGRFEACARPDAERRRLADAMLAEGHAWSVRVSLRPSDWRTFWEVARHEAPGSRMLALLDAGTGWIMGEDLARWVEPWRDRARARGGHLVVERAPRGKVLDRRGLDPVTRRLDEAVRSRLDPSGTMAPGRWE